MNQRNCFAPACPSSLTNNSECIGTFYHLVHNESPETQCFDNLVRVWEGQEVCLPPTPKTPTPNSKDFPFPSLFLALNCCTTSKKWTAQWFSLPVKFNNQTSTSVWTVLRNGIMAAPSPIEPCHLTLSSLALANSLKLKNVKAAAAFTNRPHHVQCSSVRHYLWAAIWVGGRVARGRIWVTHE